MPRNLPRILYWILCFAVVFGAAELLARYAFAERSADWYDTLDPASGELRGQFLFVGSSITAAAVDDRTFEAVAGGRVFNMGMGGGTLPLHLLALRSLLEHDPRALEGTQVLVEMPAGIPFHYDADELASDRDHLIASGQLAPLFLAGYDSDRVGWLWSGPLSLETRLSFTLRIWTRGLALSRWRESCRQAVLGGWQELVSRTLAALGADPEAREVKMRDVVQRGGIRADEKFAARAQQLIDQFRDAAQLQADYPDFEHSVLRDLVELLQSSGAHVYFFAPPLHSVTRQLYERDATAGLRQDIAAAAERLHVAVLRPDFQEDDLLFPDAFHLSRTAAPQFTRALAEAWLAARDGTGQ